MGAAAAPRFGSPRPWFLDRFGDVRPSGIDSWRMACPGCGGARRFSISLGRDRWIANCFGAPGAKTHVREALAALGLRFDDLLLEAGRVGDYTPAVDEPLSSPLSPIDTLGSGQATAKDIPGRSDEADVERALGEWRAGRLEPEQAWFPALPPRARPVHRDVLAHFALVYGLRLAMDDERPVLYSGRWAAGQPELARWPERAVYRALDRLVEFGALRRGPDMPPQPGKRPTHTFLPGVAADWSPRVVGGEK